MASWKKIITSGSNADLNQISASALRIDGGQILVTGSGTITADNFAINPDGNAIPVSAGGTGVKELTAGQILLANAGGTGLNSVASSSLKFEHLSGVDTYGAGLVSASSATNARTHLGLGSIATQDASNISITGGSIGSSSMPDIPISSSGIVSMSNASNVFSGSFVGDGAGLTGISFVESLTDLTDVGTATTTAGNLLVADGSDFDSVAIGGDATLASDGTLTLGATNTNLTTLTKVTTMGENSDNVDFDGGITVDEESTFDSKVNVNQLSATSGVTISGSLGTFEDSDGNTRNIGLRVDNDVSASGFVGEFFEISSSVVFSSASTDFGDSDTSTHTFNGDIIIGTGSTSLGPNDTGYPSYASSSTGIFGVLGMEDISGSLGQNVDLRSAFGGVSGSFVGKFRGDGSELTGLATNVFSTIVVDGQSNVTADNNNDTLTIASSSDGLKITTSANTITFDLDAVPDTSLAQITTANKVAVSSIDIDGASDIGAALVDADLLLVDDGAGGTNRKTALSRIPTYLNNHSSITSLNSLTSVGTLTGLTVNGDVSISDGTNDFDIASHDGSNGLKLGGTLVTSDAAELNTLDGATAGTVVASKAVVVDSNKDISGFRNISADGNISGTISQANQSNITTVGALDGGSITSNFGAINNGASAITTTGVGSFGSVTTTGNVDVGGDLTITGDFTVLGDTTNVQVDTLSIEDNIIVIGSGSNSITSNTAIDTGIAFERGGDSEQRKYATFFFDESANRFAMGLTDDTAGGVISGSTDNNPSLVDNPAYVMTVVHSDTDPTTTQIEPSASLDSATDFGSSTNDAVGQVKIVGGDIFIYTD